MPTKGNPYAIVRLEPDVMKIVQDLALPHQRGRGGGVSQYLRELVYSHLGLGPAPVHAAVEVEQPKPKRRQFYAAPELND
jgi:hypothetical protein